MSELYKNTYNPDVLSCLANLSSDEVFTPPEIANAMLDLLPKDIWKNSKATFLDPACKSGIFLREIAKRLLEGLKDEIPDLQKRIDHIFHNQLFAISITELTSLLSRRSVYCSKFPNGKYSISHFDNEQGNIYYKPQKHTWKDGKCIYCGASQHEYDRSTELESHAYAFIHKTNFKEILNMHFDVIIGNPPYQLNDGGGDGASAKPIYQFFVEKAKKLNPRYLSMIIPARWYAGGKGLDDFRHIMLNDKHITHLVDYTDSSECFNGVKIKGGICYFLWDRETEAKCKITSYNCGNKETIERYLLEDGADIFIRYNQALNIFKKVNSVEHLTQSDNFMSLVSARRPFGFASTFKDFCSKDTISSIKIYANKTIKNVKISNISQNKDWISKPKIFITFAYGAGDGFPHQIINKPIFSDELSCCTETYLVIGPFKSSEIAKNVLSYIQTKFFRFMVLLRKNTQNATRNVYQYVPLQDFSTPWTDEELYKKYNLSDEDISFIESMIKPMELEEQ